MTGDSYVVNDTESLVVSLAKDGLELDFTPVANVEDLTDGTFTIVSENCFTINGNVLTPKANGTETITVYSKYNGLVKTTTFKATAVIEEVP